MNTSLFTLEPNLSPIGIALLIPILITLIGFPIISTILFPFYIKVSRKNRERDEQTVIFPFILYFHHVTCVTEALFLAGLLSLIVVYIQIDYLWITIWTWGICLLVKMTVALMLNILTSLLAFQRSILYFFPKFAVQGLLTRKIAHILIWILHFLVFYLFFTALTSQNPDQKAWDNRMRILQFSLYGLVLFCIFPYFLMILSIRKLSHLSSKVHLKPERYIKYQIGIIVLAKIFMIPFLICSFDKGSLIRGMPNSVFLNQLLWETATSSVTIQISYLLNNKVNLDTLKNSCCVWKKVAPVGVSGSF